ncbi:MAG: RnfABCDGE type electron transport complex subunit D, partial [Victivallales bacterium]|nr:RnfABCDGE type electron transport complex subunit D [Victivallales bacterium]
MTEEQVRMPDTSRLIISSSPHFHAPASIHNIMFTVVLALVPTIIAAAFHFGIRALWVMLVTVAASVAWETLACKALKRPLSIDDGTAVLTGLLLALTFPPTIPEWVCIVGAL